MAIGKHYDLDTDVTLTGNSDTAISSQKAVKTYADTKADPTIFRDENSDTPVKELVINRLTDAEYDVIVKNDTELYLTPDTTDQDIANAINAHNTSNSAHSALFNAKQDTLTTQTAYTSKGTATKVPQITTNTLGQVTGITEVDISHQDIKTLNTDNTTGQTASSSEAIAGSGTINLHKVSKTGSYNDLLNTPTIPTVNDSTITIQKNSTTVDTFTLNQSTNKSINISVPTTVAELSDSSDYVQTSSLEEAATVAKTGSYTDLINKPTKLSDFTDDLGSSPTHTHSQYLTSHQTIKTLNTTNTTAQSTSASETLTGSGTINLHKIAKTGTFSDLISKPTSISGYGITDAYTKTEIDGMISSVYKPAGSVAFASLPALSDNVLGNVYNVTDAFTTTADFVEGAGKSYPAGTNVVVVNTGTTASPIYKFDVLAGFVDLSGYVPTSRTVNGKALSADITISKSDVGLGNVDNTSDADKPISAATQTALDTKANKTNIINGAPLSNTSSYFFATSDTAAATVQKEVSIPSITSLNAGQIIIVKPTVTSTVANSTIKLNSFDAYPMIYNNNAITTSSDSVVWNANFPSIWVFDGTNWVFAGHGVDSNTTYSNMSVAEGTTGTATSQRTMRADYLKQIIQGTVLTGLNVSTISVIDATDTILSALGKLQAQINDRPEYSAVFVDWSD